MAKFNKNVTWLEPYYEDVKHLLGNHRLDRVIGYQVKLGQRAHAEGRTIIHESGAVNITLKTHFHGKKDNGQRVQKALTIGTILITFAHELAHLKYWDHSEKHWQLQCYLLQHFTHTMKVLGLNDHEADAYEE